MIRSFSSPLRAALLGCGKIGWEFQEEPSAKSFGVCTHAAAWHELDEVELVAVADSNIEKARACGARWNVHGAYDHVGSLLEAAQPEIVSIATPDETHAVITHECLRFPSIQAVFVEKPMASNADEAANLCALAKQLGKKIVVNYSRRFCPIYHSLRQKIQTGQYGKVRLVRALYTKGLRHNGSHALDLMIFWFGGFEIKQVADVPWARNNEETDPPLDVSFLLGEDGQGTLQSLPYQDYTVFELDVCFENARFLLTDGGDTIAEYVATADQPFTGYRGLVCRAKSDQCLNNYLLHAARHVRDLVLGCEENLSSGEESIAILKELDKT